MPSPSAASLASASTPMRDYARNMARGYAKRARDIAALSTPPAEAKTAETLDLARMITDLQNSTGDDTDSPK